MTDTIRGRTVSVIGLGNSGYNAALLLAEHGARVMVTESADSEGLRANAEKLKALGIAVELGGHTGPFVERSSLVVVSPGVAETSAALEIASRGAIPVIGEMELGYRYCRGKIVAITGTNGKTTVTTLIGDMLREAGRDTVVCGNIGNSLSGEWDRIREDTWVVLEVSSFQLDRIVDFRPSIAVLLNITDDHLDRYRDFGAYYESKMAIFRNQRPDDYLVLNRDAGNLRPVAERAPSSVVWYSKSSPVNGSYVRGNQIMIRSERGHRALMDVGKIRLTGIHNRENVLACITAASLAGVPREAIVRAVESFRGLPHRVEFVAAIGGVEYFDDSKGTTVDSTRRALESFGEGSVVLIAGGRDKMSDFAAIRDAVKEKVSHLVLIGEARKKIRDALGDLVPTHDAETMDDAVERASRLAGRGGAVLLSPMCASFDMFKNYGHRGDVFQDAVRRLAQDRPARKTGGRAVS